MEYGLKPLAFWAITLPLTYSVTMINPVGWWGLQFTQDLTDYKLITWLGSRIFSFTLNKNRSCVWFLAHLVQFADISKNTSDLLSEIGRHFCLKVTSVYNLCLIVSIKGTVKFIFQCQIRSNTKVSVFISLIQSFYNPVFHIYEEDFKTSNYRLFYCF